MTENIGQQYWGKSDTGRGKEQEVFSCNSAKGSWFTRLRSLSFLLRSRSFGAPAVHPPSPLGAMVGRQFRIGKIASFAKASEPREDGRQEIRDRRSVIS